LDHLAASINELTGLAASLRMRARIRLTGHSDDTGPGTYNLSLRIARAGAVLALLEKPGVAAVLITIGGPRRLHPPAPHRSDNGRTLNRRVSGALRIEGEP